MHVCSVYDIMITVICMENRFAERKHTRMAHYDYSTAGAYYVTICTHNRRCLLSRVVGRRLAPAETELSVYGKIAQEQLLLLEKRFPLLKVDQYVIMPNHIHAVLILEETAGASPRPTLTDIVCAYKSLTTRACKKLLPINKLFQTSFYEHVIRGREDYKEIVKYIAENPSRWESDNLYLAD